MAGTETSEAPKQSESVYSQLQALHANGILLSEEAENQLIATSHKSADLYTLKLMASSLQKLEDSRKLSGGINPQDFKLVEETLRRINNVSEIENKYDALNDLNEKYHILLTAGAQDKIDWMTGMLQTKLPRSLYKRYGTKELEIVHALSPKEAIGWMKKHSQRVELLNSLINSKIVPLNQYRQYREMTPEEALSELNKIKAKKEKREHASADRVLDQDLNRIA